MSVSHVNECGTFFANSLTCCQVTTCKICYRIFLFQHSGLKRKFNHLASSFWILVKMLWTWRWLQDYRDLDQSYLCLDHLDSYGPLWDGRWRCIAHLFSPTLLPPRTAALPQAEQLPWWGVLSRGRLIFCSWWAGFLQEPCCW